MKNTQFILALQEVYELLNDFNKLETHMDDRCIELRKCIRDNLQKHRDRLVKLNGTYMAFMNDIEKERA